MATFLYVDSLAAGTSETLASPTMTGTISVGRATDTVGFFGVGAATQASVVSALATTAVATTGFGFTTTAQGNAVVAAVNSILASLKTFGLMATT